MAKTVELRDEADALFSSDVGQLVCPDPSHKPGRSQLGMRAKFEAVVHLGDDDIDAQGSELWQFGD